MMAGKGVVLPYSGVSQRHTQSNQVHRHHSFNLLAGSTPRMGLVAAARAGMEIPSQTRRCMIDDDVLSRTSNVVVEQNTQL